MERHSRTLLLSALAVVLLLAATAVWAQRSAPAASSDAHRPIGWDALVAPGWDGMKAFRGTELQQLGDADPRAAQLLRQMREAWDRAPVNVAWVNQPVRIAGYVVPLEEGREGIAEFLLVPYHGACIHSPPPPANQIIHVLPRAPARGLRSMDTVWVSGTLRYARNDSALGVSSWRLEAGTVEPYAEGVVPPGAPRTVR